MIAMSWSIIINIDCKCWSKIPSKQDTGPKNMTGKNVLVQ